MSRLIALTALLVLAAPALAFGDPTAFQAYHGARVDKRPDDPPSPRPAQYLGPPLTLAHSYIGRDAAEPMISQDRSGAVFFSAGAFDGPFGLARQELRRSTDGGATWQPVQAPFGTGGGEVVTLDPFVIGDRESNRIFAITLLGAGSYLAFTDDSGRTFEQSALSSPGVNDHQTLTPVKPPEGFPPSSDPAFPNYVYYCVNQVSDARCVRSADGGRTFSPTGGPAYLQSGEGEEGQGVGPCSALHGHLRGDGEGRLFLPAGHCGLPTLAISEDAGLTWRRSIVSREIGAADVHTSVAVDAAGNLYYVWWDPLHRLPYMAVSTDHGETWGQPIMIAPPGVVEVNFPVAVAGDVGRVAVNFPASPGEVEIAGDAEYDATKQRPWFTYVVTTTNALADDPLFLSNTAGPRGDPVHRGDCGPGRCRGMFDFMDITLSPVDGSIWASATDTCTAQDDCAGNLRKGRATDAEGVAVHQVGGPKLVGEGFFGPAAGGGPTARTRSSAPSARRVRVTCTRTRCRVRLAGAPGGTAVALRIYGRGRRLVAAGGTRLERGRGVVRLRRGSRPARLRRGRYTVAVTVTRSTSEATRTDRRVRVR